MEGNIWWTRARKGGPCRRALGPPGFLTPQGGHCSQRGAGPQFPFQRAGLFGQSASPPLSLEASAVQLPRNLSVSSTNFLPRSQATAPSAPYTTSPRPNLANRRTAPAKPPGTCQETARPIPEHPREGKQASRQGSSPTARPQDSPSLLQHNRLQEREPQLNPWQNPPFVSRNPCHAQRRATWEQLRGCKAPRERGVTAAGDGQSPAARSSADILEPRTARLPRGPIKGKEKKKQS